MIRIDCKRIGPSEDRPGMAGDRRPGGVRIEHPWRMSYAALPRPVGGQPHCAGGPACPSLQAGGLPPGRRRRTLLHLPPLSRRPFSARAVPSAGVHSRHLPPFHLPGGRDSPEKSVLLLRDRGILLDPLRPGPIPEGGPPPPETFPGLPGISRSCPRKPLSPQPDGGDRKRLYDRTLRGHAAPLHPDLGVIALHPLAPLVQAFRIHGGKGAGLRLGGGPLPPGDHRGSCQKGRHGDPCRLLRDPPGKIRPPSGRPKFHDGRRELCGRRKAGRRIHRGGPGALSRPAPRRAPVSHHDPVGETGRSSPATPGSGAGAGTP